MAGRPSLAVVGSGPAAFYTVIRALQKSPSLKIDMFERQCFPYGLTRYGVAPDHPEVKNCQERFAEVAGEADFRFHGNCEVGKDVPLRDLALNFDAVLLAYGASSERELGIPGETGPGVFSARKFVGWYNGEPECQRLDVLSQLRRGEHATIIGNGNVALDIARILLRKPEQLKATDISPIALQALTESRIKHVKIVGRRGVLHSAFTNKELRELQREPGTAMLPRRPESELDVEAKTRQDKRKLDLLKQAQGSSSNQAPRTWALEFLRTPQAFVRKNNGLDGISWMLNRYKDDGTTVEPTGEALYEPTDIAFTSIGYRSLPIPGLDELGVQFDPSRGVIPRHRGKVRSHTGNIFASGWVATGPVGVIASTMMDSFAVGDEIAHYVSTLDSFKGGRETLSANNSSRVISWADWLRIDSEEMRRGKDTGRPRDKFLSTPDVLKWLDHQKII